MRALIVLFSVSVCVWVLLNEVLSPSVAFFLRICVGIEVGRSRGTRQGWIGIGEQRQ